jgi:hypothetical protein
MKLEREKLFYSEEIALYLRFAQGKGFLKRFEGLYAYDFPRIEEYHKCYFKNNEAIGLALNTEGIEYFI